MLFTFAKTSSCLAPDEFFSPYHNIYTEQQNELGEVPIYVSSLDNFDTIGLFQ